MKNLFFAVAMLFGSTTIFASTPPEINEKVLKAFQETFTNPQDVNWHEYPNYYEVDFKQDEIKTQVRYDADGNITGTTRYYFEKNLPPHILANLKRKYPQRSVYGVTEIYAENDLQYYVTMEDDRNWYIVKSNAVGNLDQTEKYKKAPTK